MAGYPRDFARLGRARFLLRRLRVRRSCRGGGAGLRAGEVEPRVSLAPGRQARAGELAYREGASLLLLRLPAELRLAGEDRCVQGVADGGMRAGGSAGLQLE